MGGCAPQSPFCTPLPDFPLEVRKNWGNTLNWFWELLELARPDQLIFLLEDVAGSVQRVEKELLVCAEDFFAAAQETDRFRIWVTSHSN